MMKKRIFALVTCFVMLLGILPVHAYVITSEAQLPFTDTVNGWYTPALTFCYVNNIMKGTADTLFTPKGETTREQMMTVLANISGEDISGYSQCAFTDVRSGVWYTDYVNWAVANGITKGISETQFGIKKPLTRQETVTLIYNYTVSIGIECDAAADLTAFADNDKVADWAMKPFGWAVSVGVISGNNGNLNPRDNITRAELAQVIRTFMENVIYGDCEHSYTDVTCTESAYCTLCGMVNGMPKGHRCPVLTCDTGSQCADCGVMIAPKGHNFVGADCTKTMICSVCKASSGKPLGHTTDNGVCARCKKEIFTNAYAKFAYYMKNCGMTDGNVKYLMADVTHAEGNTSTQYVKYDTSTGKGSFEIIFDFAKNDHAIKTVISFGNIATTYNAESYYSIGGKVQYSGTGSITAKNCAYTLSAFNGISTYKSQFETLAKNSLLLSLDSTNQILKSYVNMTAADFGFAAFK